MYYSIFEVKRLVLTFSLVPKSNIQVPIGTVEVIIFIMHALFCLECESFSPRIYVLEVLQYGK